MDSIHSRCLLSLSGDLFSKQVEKGKNIIGSRKLVHFMILDPDCRLQKKKIRYRQNNQTKSSDLYNGYNKHLKESTILYSSLRDHLDNYDARGEVRCHDKRPSMALA